MILGRTLLIKLIKRLRLVRLRDKCWQVDWQADGETVGQRTKIHRETRKARRLTGWQILPKQPPLLQLFTNNNLPTNTSFEVANLMNTEPESSWGQSALVSGAGVLVGGDGHQLQHPLGSSPVHPTSSEVNQDQVVVCSTCEEEAEESEIFVWLLV